MSARPGGPKRATCPECSRRVRVFRFHHRTLFEHHTSTGNPHGDACNGSGYLVEAEDDPGYGSDRPQPASWHSEVLRTKEQTK